MSRAENLHSVRIRTYRMLLNFSTQIKATFISTLHAHTLIRRRRKIRSLHTDEDCRERRGYQPPSFRISLSSDCIFQKQEKSNYFLLAEYFSRKSRRQGCPTAWDANGLQLISQDRSTSDGYVIDRRDTDETRPNRKSITFFF